MKHPNAFTALVTTFAAAVSIAVAKRLGYNLSQEQAAIAAGAAITTALFLGREVWTRGLRGIALALWRGANTVVTGTGKAKP